VFPLHALVFAFGLIMVRLGSLHLTICVSKCITAFAELLYMLSPTCDSFVSAGQSSGLVPILNILC
jgi:hypothetical protein